MDGERTMDGLEFRLRPRGPGRWFKAAFLGLWLCGWAAGEAFALWALVIGARALLTGEPPKPAAAPLQVGAALGMGAFLLAWLAVWTLGGIAAGTPTLQSWLVEDRPLAHSQ